jgi:hypothetical protein
MMKTSRFLALSRRLAAAAALALLAACDVVMSLHPVGSEPVSLAAEAWQGTWINDDGAVTLVVPEGPPGRLQLAWIEVTDRPELHTALVHVRSAGDWLFGSFEEHEGDEPPRYIWGRLLNDEGTILFWLPREEKIRELVQAGVLPGEIDEDGDVTLTELGPQHLAILTSEDHGTLFAWDDPTILRRLGG